MPFSRVLIQKAFNITTVHQELLKCLILEDSNFTRQADEVAMRSDGEPVSIQLGKAALALFEHHSVTMEMGNQLQCVSTGHR